MHDSFLLLIALLGLRKVCVLEQHVYLPQIHGLLKRKRPAVRVELQGVCVVVLCGAVRALVEAVLG